MKLNIAISTLLAVASVVDASPIDFVMKKKHNKSTSVSSSSTTSAASPTAVIENVTNSTVTSNHSNITTYSSLSNSTVPVKETLQVIITGGHVQLINTSTPATNYTTLFNQSTPLNFTQLYDVAQCVNRTSSFNDTKGTVIVTNEKSLEALGFFAAIVFNQPKPVVVGTDAALASIVAKNTEAANRGALVVDRNGVIYSGIFAPTPGQAASSIPVGAIDDQKNVTWFFDSSLPSFIKNSSTLRTTYANFTNVNTLKHATTAPLIPIIYDGGYNEDLVKSVTYSTNGLVVISSGTSTNSTASKLTSGLIPVIYTESSPLAVVSAADVPKGVISGGYLTPVKAQVFLGIAIANGVTNSTSIAALL